MEDALSTIDTGVGDETVSVLGDTFLMCDLLRHAEEMPDQYFILRFEGADGFDMFVWYDQDVRPRHGVDIAEGRCLFITVNDLRFGFAGNDLAEDTGVGHGMSDP